MRIQRTKIEINPTLFELWVGIAGFGILCQAVIVWFVRDKAGYSAGLWIGAVLAVFGAWHMWRTLDRALELGEKDAVRIISSRSFMRYGALLIALGILLLTGWANPLAAFLGAMGMKASAYLQPFTHKFIRRLSGADKTTDAIADRKQQV